ncbi:MAG: TetR/AcrR family transcriptional regulator, partial [Leptolyngbya sp. SIO4C1]|nr:TetR/AcrR family transcriptional regulator [Leptolyngbya sp. SIO4C1]
MPKQTFFNLPEKKRQNITELAIAEFASADFENASISNIVKQAKIAKGSFYQYFEDKKDLYLYLVDTASQQRMDYIHAEREAESSEKREQHFFAELHWLFTVSTRFSMQHPKLNQIINRAAYGDSPIKEDVLERLQAAAKRPIFELVEKGIANGDLRPELDPDLATYIIVTASNNLRYFIPEKLVGVHCQL